MWWKIQRPFRNFFSNIRRVIAFLPVIWKTREWDYHYAITIFKFQLERIANALESNEAVSLGSEQRAQKIRTVCRLMDKVYNEDYELSALDEADKIYGSYTYKSIPLEEDHPEHGKLYRMVRVWERDYTEEEIRQIDNHTRELIETARLKQKRAHKLLWELVEHYIQSWWD